MHFEADGCVRFDRAERDGLSADLTKCTTLNDTTPTGPTLKVN